MKKLSYTYRVGGKKTQGLLVTVVLVSGMMLVMTYEMWSEWGALQTAGFVGMVLLIGILIYLFVDSQTDDMLDEVYEDGETLLLKRSGKECRVPLADIKNICFSGNGGSEVMLFLRHPTEWGDHLRYYACTSSRWAFWRYKREANQATKDLIERIDRMRNVLPDSLNQAEPIQEKDGVPISFYSINIGYILCFGHHTLLILIFVHMMSNARFLEGGGMLRFLFVLCIAMQVRDLVKVQWFFWHAIEKVFDGGDHLLLKKSGREERIPLRNIKNVNYSNVLSPFRVTLDLRHPCQWGDRVVFLPPSLWLSEKRNGEMIDDLIDRIDRARIAASSNPSSVAMAQPSGHWKSKEDRQMEQGAGSQAME